MEGLSVLVELALPQYRYTAFAEKVANGEPPKMFPDIIEPAVQRVQRSARAKRKRPATEPHAPSSHATAWDAVRHNITLGQEKEKRRKQTRQGLEPRAV